MILSKYSYDTMELYDIAEKIEIVQQRGPIHGVIKGLTYDSRLVQPDYLFVALPGTRTHGVNFLDDALARGAIAVISEQDVSLPNRVSLLQVKNAQIALAQVAAAFHRYPSSYLKTVGITGTNGKTTTAYLIRAMLEEAGHKPGLIGTVEYVIGERRIPASRTTPQAPELQAMLDQMVESECKSVVMETSSHALHQHRVMGIDFDVAVFTNCTQDHLDYHHTMEQYFEAKSRLFMNLGTGDKKGVAVVNDDDPFGRRLADELDSNADIITYGTQASAQVHAEQIELSSRGIRFRAITPQGEAEIEMRLIGRFNISNALAAIAVGHALDISLDTMARVMASVTGVPGRLEGVPCNHGKIYVDYAHTEHALENVLKSLREMTAGHLNVVFGCGGDRDQDKRAPMGAVAARLADFAIITTDNPRSESPEQIAASVAKGFADKQNYEIILDRENAIAEGISRLDDGDVLLIAGKGHENYMEFNNTVVPFDDREVALRLISTGARD